MRFPKRSRQMAHLLAGRLERTRYHATRIDGCMCVGTPATGVKVKNALGVDTLTWDAFRELWLMNVECDQHFVTKPHLFRQRI